MHKPRIDPEFKALIPPLTPDEYNQLEQNILAQGCRDPIALWRNNIVDGHNRHEICTRHGIPYKTIKLRFPSREAAKIWILENQLGRRNLSDAMRIELAARKVGYMGQKDNINQNIARTAKLSTRTIRRYMRIKNNGGEELLAKVMSGEYKIGTAHRHMEAGMEVTTTTIDEMPFTPQTTEERNFYCQRGIMSNIRQIEAVFVFLAEHRPRWMGMTHDVRGRINFCFERVWRLVG